MKRAKRRNKGGDDEDDEAAAVLVAVETNESSLKARSRTMFDDVYPNAGFKQRSAYHFLVSNGVA